MKIPMLVKFASGFVFATAAVSLGVGILALLFSGFWNGPGINQIMLIAVSLMLLAVFIVIVGIKLLKGRNWARVLLLVTTGLWSIIFIVQTISSLRVVVSDFFPIMTGLASFILLVRTFSDNNSKIFFDSNKFASTSTVA